MRLDRSRSWLLAVVALAPLAAGAAPAEEGLATFYADRFEGRRTANGERYRAEAWTCAHRTHPFGAVLEVTDVESGRRVRVRVNDRGPYGKGRIVDLSKAAARELGILRRGVARVRVVRVE